MLAAFPIPRRHASAVRRFPPGCGRHHYSTHPPQHPHPSAANLLLPNPSAWTATKTTSYPPKQTLPAAAFPGTDGPDRGEGNESVVEIKVLTTAAVTARRSSAMRRYPPGCGRGVAVSKPGALMGEGDADASKPQAAVCNGEAKAIADDQKVVLCESTLGHEGSNSNGVGKSGGDGGGGAQEESGGRPWIVTGLMLAPFLPWAQHGRRSLRRKLL